AGDADLAGRRAGDRQRRQLVGIGGVGVLRRGGADGDGPRLLHLAAVGDGRSGRVVDNAERHADADADLRGLVFGLTVAGGRHVRRVRRFDLEVAGDADLYAIERGADHVL